MQGASHQIFHILIDIGQVIFLTGLQEVMRRRYHHADGPVAILMSQETSLSVLVESGVALWEGNQVQYYGRRR